MKGMEFWENPAKCEADFFSENHPGNNRLHEIFGFITWSHYHEYRVWFV